MHAWPSARFPSKSQSLTRLVLSPRYHGSQYFFQVDEKVLHVLPSPNFLGRIDWMCDVELHDALAAYIKSIRPGSNFRGIVWLKFGGLRDKYLNSRGTLLRFDIVEDMLFDPTDDDAIMNVEVEMQDDDDVDTIEVKLRRTAYGYHRIATLPVVEEEEGEHGINTQQQLQPMTWAILQRRFRDHKNLEIEVVRVLERNINGHSYGDCNAARRIRIRLGEQAPVVLMSLPHDCKAPEYAHLSDEELGQALSENLKEDQRELFSTRDAPSPNVPKLPDMTFQRYPLKRSGSDMPKGETFLAVTMVNQLHSDSKFPRTFKLPADVQICTEEKSNSIASIRKSLKRALENFCQEKNLDTICLFQDGLKSLWHFDLWVVPQKGSEGGGEKLYRMEGDDCVNMFLDPEMVREGKRTMYMEAHLLPNATVR